ncbi:MAG TPA: FecR domain-containing protein [Casimicrobiaceae bacterium]|nr:FecR domain-containing protein [Casimicrobiaceae bacterium]
MNRCLRHLILIASFPLFGLAAGAALAQAGKVVFAVGDVVAVRGASRVPLSAGSPLEVGDTIVTAAQSHAQLRFSDDALVALKPDSEFRIERYSFSGHDDGTEVAVFRLVKGGFRTLTGQIGKLSGDRYQLLTTQATIGIRGTHYQVQICGPRQCMDNGQAAKSGMYGAVYEGRIAVANAFGAEEFGIDELFYVPDGEAPLRWLAPPLFLSDKLTPRTSSAKSEGGDLRFGKVPDSEVNAAIPAPGFTYLATEDLDRISLTNGVTALVGSDRDTLELDRTTDPNLKLTIDAQGRLTGFENASLTASLGSASIVDSGHDDSSTGLNWGRWQGSGSTIAQRLGNDIVHNDGGNLHYIYGTTATALPTSGQVQYAALGGTRPTDSGTGQVGTLLSGGTISVNFTTAQLALSGLSVGFANATYTMGGTASIANGAFATAGIGATGACSGAGCQPLIASNFTGFLAGPGGAGIGLDYYFNTRTGGVIEGVAGYKQCPGGKC